MNVIHNIHDVRKKIAVFPAEEAVKQNVKIKSEHFVPFHYYYSEEETLFKN